ncbi:MAG TPA: efflux RND transporter periplasmic adaptor subunit [Stellaceae bacterium]|nr:efflux RND transporter periplasmic adaptor subunit [Stellaceae bacterium]
MDGNLQPLLSAESEAAGGLARAPAGPPQPAANRPKTGRWLVIVGALLLVVLGGLYQFNRFRSQAIATFFAHNKPPPVEISAVTATTEAVPRFAEGIGSLAAVQQVTVSPQVGGLVTKIFFTAGQHVKAGDALVQLDDGPDRADLANYQAQARYAQVQLQRNLALVKKSFVSQDTVDQNQAQLDEARAEIAKTEAIIAQKLIRAPFAGRLGLRQVDLGQYLSAGAPIATLTNLATLYVNFTLPSTRRSEIAIGQAVDVRSDAFPGRVFHAAITAIEPQISADTRMIAVQATMTNSDEALLPGMFLTADVVLPQQPDEVVLPTTAVDYTLYGDAVYVIRSAAGSSADPVLRAWRTPVRTGAAWGGKVAILDGLKPGERVVAAGQLKIQQNGAEVAISSIPPPPPPAHPTLH